MSDPGWFTYLKWQFRIRACQRELASRAVTPKAHGMNAPLVVSLTSYPPRFPKLHLTLQCLLKQTVVADETVLWIAFDHMDLLTPEVLKLQENGLTIRACEDIRSYKKLIHALNEDPDRYIVTADDDCYYPANWLEQLVDASNSSPRSIISHRAHYMLFHSNGNLHSYENWKKNIDKPHEGPDIFATGVGGILYPPHSLDVRVTDQELFTKICPHADDVWFHWMARLKGTCVRHVGPKTRVLEWAGTQDVSLRSINRGNLSENGNDRAIAAMKAEFGLPNSK